MRGLVIHAFILTGLFYFSEGKPCPEKTRPHKTRCDAFYKCHSLSNNGHVWLPSQCQEGLVYEATVGGCVLPGEDWECLTQSELASTTTSRTGDIIILSDGEEEVLRKDDGSVEVVLDGAELSSEEAVRDEGDISASNASHYDSSGDGELVELDNDQDSNNDRNKQSKQGVDLDMPAMSKQESMQQLKAEIKQVVAKPNSQIDPSLTAHLQRLSQLIDGLQQSYQKTDKPPMELRPDQINAFLAHFDIKNRFDTLNPTPAVSSYKSASISTTTEAPMVTTTSTTTPAPLPLPSANKSRLQDHLNMRPETKVELLSQLYGLPSAPSSNSPYSNSQIVVNRPEGSVLFALPHYQEQLARPDQHQQSHEYSSEPKISEETLKTVLELSKQMIAVQNMPNRISNPVYNYNQDYNSPYYPHILQPLILAPQPHAQNPYQQYYTAAGPNPASYSHHPQQHRKRPHHSSTNSGTYSEDSGKPSTTIIHNNVIPVHVSSTNSGEQQLLDSYGNNLGRYPPHQSDSNNNYYNSNKFLATMTTARPAISVTTMSSVNQYDFTMTTPRPFDHPPPSSASTLASFYTPSPHLSEQNIHRVYQLDESYPTVGSTSSMFPAQLSANQVKVRPNSQKIESMEVEPEAAISSNYNSNNNDNILTYSSHVEAPSQQLAPGSYVEQQSPYMPRPSTSSATSKDDFQSSYQQRYPSLSSSIASSSDDFQNTYQQKYPSLASSSGISSDDFQNMYQQKYPSNDDFQSSYQQKYPSLSSSISAPLSHKSQLVNFGGNFISMDVFQQSIVPLLGQASELGQVEVISCQASGVRQPNSTDCTRYFVCSKKDGKVLSYSCPPYTGFNKLTRICDAQTYAQCGTTPIFSSYSIDDNKRRQEVALKALAEVKRRQEAAIKAQSIASLLQQYGGSQESPAPSSSSSSEQLLHDAYMVIPTTTQRPSPPSTQSLKKRKYYCKEGDKLPDQTSISSYFVCYKNAQGQMKGHKMVCSKGLLFCPKSLMCTLAAKCN